MMLEIYVQSTDTWVKSPTCWGHRDPCNLPASSLSVICSLRPKDTACCRRAPGGGKHPAVRECRWGRACSLYVKRDDQRPLACLRGQGATAVGRMGDNHSSLQGWGRGRGGHSQSEAVRSSSE